ncbi:MAG: hypothetical protein JWQ79_3541, partial [Mucilaginibacter sp.]|nr:hypothetical protein [Mucilaginibacter sp.]
GRGGGLLIFCRQITWLVQIKQVMKYLICISLIFGAFSIKAQQKISLSGTIVDDSGHPISGVTVFLANTKNATATDAFGKFNLNGLPAGNYQLITSMIGFESADQNIKLQDELVNIIIKLKQSNQLLNAVNITSTPKNRQFLNIFIKNFIGSSPNASKCKILNTEVLNFTKNKEKNTLEATTDDFLVIENDALGYRLKYLLKNFVYYFQYDVCDYDGEPFFEELKGTEQQQQQWALNRKIAYLGSSRHFFRSVMNKNSIQEGFYVKTLNQKKGQLLTPVNIDTVMTPINSNINALIKKKIVLKGKVTEIKPIYYISYIMTDPEERSWIRQFADTIMVDKNGNIVRGMGFSFHGKWATQRISDLTPLDYFVDPPEGKSNKP